MNEWLDPGTHIGTHTHTRITEQQRERKKQEGGREGGMGRDCVGERDVGTQRWDAQTGGGGLSRTLRLLPRSLARGIKNETYNETYVKHQQGEPSGPPVANNTAGRRPYALSVCLHVYTNQ
mmetsp:Transcript_36482/g.91245  ORF Transcript_36482/g.91245 Transcript_36482/m.91245 type:complete len:121 (-) Transcript_36482:21-383(-)